jgi:hypothetical protein
MAAMLTLQVGFSDPQCRFKAITRQAAAHLIPEVHDGDWFFDTELLVLAERAGVGSYEAPVDITDTALKGRSRYLATRRTLPTSGTRPRWVRPSLIAGSTAS